MILARARARVRDEHNGERIAKLIEFRGNAATTTTVEMRDSLEFATATWNRGIRRTNAKIGRESAIRESGRF